MPRCRFSLAIRLTFPLLILGTLQASADEPSLRVASFQADITPALGSPLCGGWIKPLVAVDDPLWGKGVILEQQGRRYVLCALDWCEVRNRSHFSLRAQLAASAGTEPAYVAVQCLHQHNAPVIDETAQQLARAADQPLPVMDDASYAAAVARLSAAVAEAASRLAPCNAVAVGQARVKRVASSRRVADGKGGILVRYSLTTDPAIRDAEEGLIDPYVRCISLLHDGRPLARLYYYATHPMSFYGDGRATSDIPGLARAALEREEGVPQIYFTGCGGDVTAGKYNEGNLESRRALAERLAAGMRQAIAASRAEPVGTLRWRTAQATFPMRTDDPYTRAAAERLLADTAGSSQARLNGGALLLSLHLRADVPFELSSLELGPVTLVHLPGEPSIEFQFAAQRLRPDRTVCVAGYGDGGPGYLCLERHFAEGGYEPTASLVGPRSDQVLSAAMVELLGSPVPSGDKASTP